MSEMFNRITETAPFKKKAIPSSVRRSVAERYGALPNVSVAASCHYCGSAGSVYLFVQGRGHGWPSFQDLEMDHVTPEFRGGESVAENIVLACRPCNRGKGSRFVSEWRK